MKLALAVLVTLALPSAAFATIVPQRGMAGVRLGMTVKQVRAELGAPTKVIFINNDIIGRQRVYRYGLTHVAFDGAARNAKVTSVNTTSKRERLANDIGVGSTRAQVAQRVKGVKCAVEFGVDHCYLGRFEPGQTVTDFMIGSRGTVTRVTIGRVID